MHEPSSRPFASREPNNVVNRKTVSVEGKARKVQGFKAAEFQSSYNPESSRCSQAARELEILETLKLCDPTFPLFVRCGEEWLTMCRVVVII
jgi:hypothetical protein